MCVCLCVHHTPSNVPSCTSGADFVEGWRNLLLRLSLAEGPGEALGVRTTTGHMASLFVTWLHGGCPEMECYPFEQTR